MISVGGIPHTRCQSYINRGSSSLQKKNGWMAVLISWLKDFAICAFISLPLSPHMSFLQDRFAAWPDVILPFVSRMAASLAGRCCHVSFAFLDTSPHVC